MQRKIERRLKFATIAIVLAGYLALTTTFSYDWDVLIVPIAAIALMPMGERLDRRFAAYRRVTSVMILVFIAAFFMLIERFSLLDAVIALVMFIQAYSLVHVKRPKNYIHLFLMSFFLLLAAAVMLPRPDIAAVLLVYLVFTIWGLTLLEMFSTGGESPALPQWRSRNGEILPSRRVRLFDMRFTSLLGFILIGTLAFTVLLFATGPRTEAGIFGSSRTPERTMTGVSSEVDLSQAGELASNNAPVMRVQFPEEKGGQFNGPMFWRVTTLDSYARGIWQHRGLMTRGYGTDELRRIKSESHVATLEGIDRPALNWPTVRYEIYLDRPPATALPLLQLVKEVTPGPESRNVLFRWDIANDFSVVMNRGANGVYLSAVSEIISPALEQLRRAPIDFQREMSAEDIANLTREDLLPETKALVERLTRNKQTVVDKIYALQSYLQSNSFEYTRIIPVLGSVHPVDVFLLQERRGHCQLFAGALTLMVRSLGVPARLVQGYRGGTWSSTDQSYTVTEDMAHIWTEVYFPGTGWVTFDPSPMDRVDDGFSVGAVTRAYKFYLMRARMLWLRNVVSFNRDRQGASWRAAASDLLRSGVDSWDAIQSTEHRVSIGEALRRPVALLLAAFTSLTGIWGLVAFWNWTRRRGTRVMLSPDQRRAVRLWERTTRKLRHLGIKCDGKTAEELEEETRTLGVSDPAIIPGALAVYNAARFGQQPLSSEELKRWAQRIDALKAVGNVRAVVVTAG